MGCLLAEGQLAGWDLECQFLRSTERTQVGAVIGSASEEGIDKGCHHEEHRNDERPGGESVGHEVDQHRVAYKGSGPESQHYDVEHQLDESHLLVAYHEGHRHSEDDNQERHNGLE